MGWSSANRIFDPVARALIDTKADPITKRTVLSNLIRELRDGDWDTEDESLELFLDEPAIVAAFADHGITLPTVELEVPGEDADAVREFAEHRAAVRVARNNGKTLCGDAPVDRDLAWLTCTHRLAHDGEHSWYREAAP